MDDLKKYIIKRKKTDPKFAEGFEKGFEKFKIREDAYWAQKALKSEKAGYIGKKQSKKIIRESRHTSSKKGIEIPARNLYVLAYFFNSIFDIKV